MHTVTWTAVGDDLTRTSPVGFEPTAGSAAVEEAAAEATAIEATAIEATALQPPAVESATVGPISRSGSMVPAPRSALSRARLRGVTPLDVVTFIAACPACGLDAEWTEEREDTRLRASVTCACTD